jgi:hypothetical protein
MADTIVKSFVIDTSKAEQNLRSLDAASAATQASLDLLYNQLVQLDQQLNGLDPSSEAFANVNTQIQALETTISNIETGGIQNIGNAIDDIDTAKVKDVGDAIQSIDTGDAARNIESVGDAIEQVVAPVDQLANATGELNTELKDTKVDTSNLDAAAGEYKDLAVSQDEVVTSSKSLKAQLRELQAQLAATDPDSAKYRELSEAAGELKDRIQDAAQAVGTQAGGAFERVSGSLGLVTSRITSLDFTGAAEGAKQLAANIGQIKPGDIANGVKGIGSAFASIGKALLTNPIFLIGAAIAAAIIYADELLTLVDGVTDAELEQLDIQKQRAATSKQQLDAIGQQENLLRLQGKSEKEILQLKFNQAQAALNEQKIVIETVKAQRKAQIEAAERNATILEGIITFLTAPLQLILAQLDLVTQTAKDFGLISEETFAKVGNLRDRFNTSVSGLVFDPKKVAEDGDKAVAEQEKIYKDLENQQAGFQLSINQIDTKAADDKKAAREKAAADAKTAADAALKAEQQTAEELEKIRQQELDNELQRINELAAARKKANEDRIATEDAQFALRQELTLTDQQKEIQAAVKLSEDRLKVAGDDAALQKLVTDQREKDIADIIAKYKGQTTTSNAQSNSQQLQDDQNLYAAKLQAVSDSFGAIASLATAFGKGDEARAKKAFKIQKAASIAQATVDTYKGAQGVFANAAINPSTILFPAQPYIQAALAVAAGLVNVKNIASQQFQSTTPPSNDSPPPPSVGGGGNESQPAQFNPLASQFIQNQPEQITPRAFVLAGDVSSQQEVREKVQDLARLG